MFAQVSVAEQYQQTAGDDLRVLVVGAGIGGLTVTRLMRRQGRHPVLIERAGPGADPGYMLALMPMVAPVLERLDVRDAYRRASTPMRRYAVRDRHGHRVRTDAIGSLLDQYGDYRGIDRAALIDVLGGDGCPVAYETTIRTTANEDVPGEPIMVGFGSPDLATAPSPEFAFDVVILADGLGSHGRSLVIGNRTPDRTETGWSGWVTWLDTDADSDLGEELWGTGFFIGSYPVLDRIGVFVGGPDRELDRGRQEFVGSIRGRLSEIGPRIERALTAVQQSEESGAYRWAMGDVRSPSWTRNRLALVGDAAAGFMPTAGIGAGMAIESAGVLAAALQHVDRAGVAAALADYERVQRPRVESAQQNSRQLARMMFTGSRLVAVGRDLASRFVSVEVALKPIQRLLQTPPADLSGGR